MQLLRDYLQEGHRDVAVGEAEPLHQEAPAAFWRGRHTDVDIKPPGSGPEGEAKPLHQEAPAAVQHWFT